MEKKDKKEEFNKKQKLKKKSNKNSVEILASRLDQVEHRISEFEGKIDQLEHSDEHKFFFTKKKTCSIKRHH